MENGVTMLTALDTVRVLLDVPEEITLGISTIDALKETPPGGWCLRLSKNLSLRASAHTGVAIRSPKCIVFPGLLISIPIA